MGILLLDCASGIVIVAYRLLTNNLRLRQGDISN